MALKTIANFTKVWLLLKIKLENFSAAKLILCHDNL